MNNTTFPFYTSTAQQDANRNNTSYVRVCPRDRLLPFQIKRTHSTDAVSSIALVDCDGNETSLGTGYFSSIGTTINDVSSLGVKQFTSVDYIQYAGGALETQLPYGVYYLKLSDGNGIYYSEHFRVENLNADLFTTTWQNVGYNTFTTSGEEILSAIETGTNGGARTNIISFNVGEKINFTCNLTYNSGQYPFVLLRSSDGLTDYSAAYQLSDGINDIDIVATKNSDGNARVYLISTAAANFAMPWSYVRRSHGNYIKIEFSNSDDLRHSNGNDIMYSTGGFKQVVYFDTRLNNPTSEPVEIGEELDGVFVAEQLNTTYLYSVVDYVSKSMFRGLQYLPMHDDVEIIDEVGNSYTPDVGNIDVNIDWTTFDTGTLRIEFNDGAMDWVNDQTAIT